MKSFYSRQQNPISSRLTSEEYSLLAWNILDDYDQVLEINCHRPPFLRALEKQVKVRPHSLLLSSAATQAEAFIPGANNAIACSSLPRWESCYDAVLCVYRPSMLIGKELFRDLYGVLKPGGHLLIACHEPLFNGLRFSTGPQHRAAFTSAQQIQAMRDMLIHTGFKDVYHQKVNLFTGLLFAWRGARNPAYVA